MRRSAICVCSSACARYPWALSLMKQKAATKETKKREESRDNEVPWRESPPSKHRRGQPLSLTFFSLHNPAFSWQHQTVSPVYKRLLVELLSDSKNFKLKSFCLLNITLEIPIYCHTKVESVYTKMCKTVTISTSNPHRLLRTFHCTARHCFSQLPDSKQALWPPQPTGATVVFWYSLFTIHSLLVPRTCLLLPTLASQALPWDMSALKCLSPQTTGPACHHEATRSCWLVLGSLAMQGTQALSGIKAMKTQEEQMPAQPRARAHQRWHLPCEATLPSSPHLNRN